MISQYSLDTPDFNLQRENHGDLLFWHTGFKNVLKSNDDDDYFFLTLQYCIGFAMSKAT